jgi:predicted CoA-binding protein
MGKTVILGASNNPGRFSYKAADLLAKFRYDFVPVGIKKGESGGKQILPIKERPHIEEVDTITLYMNPFNQREYYNYIISLKPRRIIFNPGTENPELMELARQSAIETIEDCTLIMISSGVF